MRSSRFLFACLLSSFAAFWEAPSYAQINPDQTLGEESSIVAPELVGEDSADVIRGGAARGENLFHSFSEFNIGQSERVYFYSPEGTSNILSRVTGSSISDINGTLGTTGESDAALILMNPNGIVFGENASLDVQGAFTATTAEGIQLGDGYFSASNPATDNLLSIQPSAFFFNSKQEAMQPRISVESRGAHNLGLRVPDGESLRLLGGDVFLNGGHLNASGGQIEIGAISDTGFVTLENNRIIASDNIRRGDIHLNNGSFVDVQSSTDGDIRLFANDINILSGSELRAGISSGLGNVDSQSGDIILQATDFINLSEAVLTNNLESGATGQAGNLRLTAHAIVSNLSSIVSVWNFSPPFHLSN